MAFQTARTSFPQKRAFISQIDVTEVGNWEGWWVYEELINTHTFTQLDGGEGWSINLLKMVV